MEAKLSPFSALLVFFLPTIFNKKNGRIHGNCFRQGHGEPYPSFLKIPFFLGFSFFFSTVFFGGRWEDEGV